MDSDDELPQVLIQQCLLSLLDILVFIVLPTVEKLIRRHYLKIPYHTSILSGRAWVQELIHGHPERIRTELGVHAHVFKSLVFELTQMGYSDSKNVTLEEQLAIYLYTCVTGLTIRHVGERFQRSNETISKLVNWYLNLDYT